MIRTSPGIALACLMLAIVPSSLRAQTSGQSRVIDESGMFNKAAVEAATRSLEIAEKEYFLPVVIEVVDSLRGKPIETSAMDAVRLLGGAGLFVYIAKEEKKLYVLTRKQFEHRVPQEKRDAITSSFLAGFKTGDFDRGLSKGVEEITAILKETASKEPPLIVRDRIGLTLAGAKKALAAAEAKAMEMGLKSNIAVVDEGGHLLAFVRMDGARPASAATAQTKATSAATMRQPSGPTMADPGNAIVNLGLPGAAAASGGKITTLLGGVPIIVDGQVIGAVGVGGGTGEQDAEVAKAGAMAISEAVGGKPSAK